MNSYRFTLITHEELDRLSGSTPEASFTQSSAMARTQQAIGVRTACYGVRDSAGKLVAGALVLMHRGRKFFTYAHINQGPVINLANRKLVEVFFEGLRAELARQGVSHCIVTPNVEVRERDLNGDEVDGGFDNSSLLENLTAAGLHYCGPDNTMINGVGRWFYVKDLTGIDSEKELLTEVDYKARKRYKDALRDGLEYKELEADEMESFSRVLEATAERRGFNARADFVRALKKEFGEQCHVCVAYLDVPAAIELITARLEENRATASSIEQQIAAQERTSPKLQHKLKAAQGAIPSDETRLEKLHAIATQGNEGLTIAGGMMIEHSNEITYLMGGMLPEYTSLNYNGSNFLVTHTMIHAVANPRLTRYNFYGTNGAFSGHADDGVYKFKKHFKGRVVEQPGNYYLVVSPAKYRAYTLLGKLLGR